MRTRFWPESAPVGLDSVLLLLLAFVQLRQLPPGKGPADAPFHYLVIVAVALVLVYIALDVLCTSRGAGRWAGALHWLILGALLVLLVGVTTGYLIAFRHWWLPWEYAHDNVIQVEEAARFLLRGANPYGHSYLGTPLAMWEFEGGTQINPALFHTVALPFQIVLTAAAMVPSEAILGWFDQRFIHLAVTIPAVWALGRWAGWGRTGRTLVMLVILSPGLLPFSIEGRSDIWVVAALAVGFAALARREWFLAAIAIGLACVTKQTAWPLVPFYALYVYRLAYDATPGTGRERLWAAGRLALRRVAPFLVICLVFFLPFLAWNPQAFLDDILGYQSGTVPYSYPIGAGGDYGFATLVLALGWVRSPGDYFPFIIPQLIVGLPILCFGLRALWRRPNLPLLLVIYGGMMMALLYFGRSFHDNYLGFFLFLLSMAFFYVPPLLDQPSAAAPPLPATVADGDGQLLVAGER